jgi:hypothetical protein
MKIIQILATLFAVITVNAYAAMDHSAHRGSGRPVMGGTDCVRPQLNKMLPAHLSTVAPGSEFSFVVSNIDDPAQVSVEVKKQPVEVVAEFKDPYYIIRGKIPNSLHNTAARVDVKIHSKVASCRAAEGWLLKISEN